MRIVFCGCDGIFAGLVLRALLADARLTVAAVVRSTRVLHADYGFLRGAWQQVRRSGVVYALYLWLATAWTAALARCSVHRLSRRHGVPVHCTRNLNDAAGQAFVAAAQPDVLVCAFFNQRVGAAVCALPRVAAVNIHPSLLPQFKGVDPVFFARLDRAPILGVTVHRLSDAFDAGPILRQQTLTVEPAESLLRTTARLFALGGAVLMQLLAESAPAWAGTAQTAGGRYDSWPCAPQVRQLRGQGIALLHLADLAWVWRLSGGSAPARIGRCPTPGAPIAVRDPDACAALLPGGQPPAATGPLRRDDHG